MWNFTVVRINTSWAVQNSRHFADDIFQCSCLRESFDILNQISLNFVSDSLIVCELAMGQAIRFWHQTDRKLFQRTHVVMIASLLFQNNVARSFGRNNNVIITSCVHWDAFHERDDYQFPLRIYASQDLYVFKFFVATVHDLPPLCLYVKMYTVEFPYNSVVFRQKTHEWHSIANPWGQAVGFHLWIEYLNARSRYLTFRQFWVNRL